MLDGLVAELQENKFMMTRRQTAVTWGLVELIQKKILEKYCSFGSCNCEFE